MNLFLYLYSTYLLISLCTCQDPCVDHTVLADDTRSVEYKLPFGNPAKCDRFELTEGWYRFSEDRNIPTTAPTLDSCGTPAPIWIDGTYPKTEGETISMKACKVDIFENCHPTWNINVKNCGVFIVFQLTAFEQCEGRYCMEERTPCPEGTISDTGFTPCTKINPGLVLEGYVYPDPFIPTFDRLSRDRILVFRCIPWLSYQHEVNPSSLLYDVRWDINGQNVTIKENLEAAEITVNGTFNSTEWRAAGYTVGFAINCAIRGKFGPNNETSDYTEGWSYFVGINVYPTSLTISSGNKAEVWLWPTVPIACVFNSSFPCKVWIEMFDFNEQFTAGSSMYCNDSIAEFTKPSLCGLVLDGWRRTSQSVNISVPANAARDQEYIAVLKLRSSGSSYDPLWNDYHLQPITINVVNENLTEDYWNWHYAWCSSSTDPWFWTFDGQSYGFNDEGEFVLFRHKSKPIEVHTIQRRYNVDDTWTENCAVAVRAASDVFIIYGCSQPQKWVIRRLDCDAENEYLQVYHRWDSYEIHLPTGSIVGVYKSLDRRLNIWVQLTRADRDETEGLCGNWNENYEDDFTDRYGNVLENSTNFARTWSVSANESLFIARTRDETISLSYMYCSCSNTVRGQLSREVDCSWQENIPTCPPIHWDYEPCQIRTKRSTESADDEIDAPEEIVNHKEHPEVSTDWKNGWNESSAEAACLSYFMESPLYQTCSELDNVNTTNTLSTCVVNIRISGTTEFISDTLDSLISQCSIEIRMNTTLATENDKNGTTIYDTITNNLCPSHCKYNGIKTGDCINGYCNCQPDYTGADCRINMNTPPVLSGLSEEYICDASRRGCSSVSIYASGYYPSDQLKCRKRNGKISGSSFIADGPYEMTSAEYKNSGEVRCSLSSTKRRRKRSTSSVTSTSTVYLMSVTNNGMNFSDEVPIVTYDSSCLDCAVSGSFVLCQYKSDICVLGDVCYQSTSSQCAPTESNTENESKGKLWIVGVVMGSLVVILIIILIFKCSGKKRLTIFPLCHSDNKQKNVMNDDLVFYKTRDIQFECSSAPTSTFYGGKFYR